MFAAIYSPALPSLSFLTVSRHVARRQPARPVDWWKAARPYMPDLPAKPRYHNGKAADLTPAQRAERRAYIQARKLGLRVLGRKRSNPKPMVADERAVLDAIVQERQAAYRRLRDELLALAGDDLRLIERARFLASVNAAVAGLAGGNSLRRYLGCDRRTARRYFEPTLRALGLEWGDMLRTWRVAPVKPLARFDLSDPDDRAAAGDLFNLKVVRRQLAA